MQKRGIELISQLFFYLVIYVTEVYLITGETELPYGGMAAVVLLTIVLIAIRKYFDVHSQYVVATLILLGLTIYINCNLFEITGLPQVMVIMAAWSFMIRGFEKHVNLAKPNQFVLIIMTICYCVVDIMNYKAGSRLAFLLTFITLLMYIYYSNLINVDDYMEARKETTVMENEYMRKVTKKLSAFYVAIAGIILFVATRFSYGSFYHYIKDILYNLLSPLLKLLELGGMENSPIEQSMKKNPETLITPTPDSSTKPGNFDRILYICLFIMMAAFVLLLIYMMFKLLIKKREKSIEEKEDVKETRERVQKLKKKTHKDHKSHTKNPNTAIRKLYRKHMQGFWQGTTDSKEDKTPTEQRHLKNEAGAHIPEEVTTIYQRTRYSNKEMTKEDVHRMKELFK